MDNRESGDTQSITGTNKHGSIAPMTIIYTHLLFTVISNIITTFRKQQNNLAEFYRLHLGFVLNMLQRKLD